MTATATDNPPPRCSFDYRGCSYLSSIRISEVSELATNVSSCCVAPFAMPYAFSATGREVWQSPLFRVAGAWRSLTLSRLTGFFDLAGHLGYEFEDLVFGVARW